MSSFEQFLPRLDNLCSSLRRDYPGKSTVTCSMGVTFYPLDGITFQELCHNADLALYDAKESGRSDYGIYHK